MGMIEVTTCQDKERRYAWDGLGDPPSAHTFAFEYRISQEVRIKPLGLDGLVMQRCDRGAGQHDYQVVYWADSKRQVEWLLPHELEAKP